ncbi:MAG: hypothetical protein ABEK10_04045 [Candidatus Nanosalina sp.]
MVSETDEHGEEQESKILKTETSLYEPEALEEDREQSFDSGLVVGGFPTSIDLDPTTQVVESLRSEGVEAALVALYPSEGEVLNPDRGAVYNTSTDQIFHRLNQVINALAGDTAVFGYCAGGVYALESEIMDRNDTQAFVGSDIPHGMENFEGVIEPETDGVVFYDEKINSRVDSQHLEVHGTDHIWKNTPLNYGDAQIRAADLLAEESDPAEIDKLAETYDWLESSSYEPQGEKLDAAGL